MERFDKERLKVFVGSRIKDFRLKKGWSQTELGKRLGKELDRNPFGHNTISRYENGKINLEQDTLFALASIFGVSIDDFFPARDKKINLEDIIINEDFDVTDIEFLRHLIEKTKSLSGDDRERFMQNIRLAIEFFEKSNK